MDRNYICPVTDIEKLTDTIYSLKLDITTIEKEIKPGQFFHVLCDDAYLRRPISVCDINENILNLMFEVRGKGTESLSKSKTGDLIDILGPLGTDFNLDYENIVVVGGGIGIFPLLYLLKKSKAGRKAAILGFQCKDRVILSDEFKEQSDNVIITTDDGSIGKKGFVTDALNEYLNLNKPDIIYTCGPTVMMKKVNDIARQHNIPCQVSLEERMGCGVGACLVCACEVKHEGEIKNIRVCKDGPCFWGNEVYHD